MKCCDAGFFNIGSVLGLSVTPLLSAQTSWPQAFGIIGSGGVVCAIYALQRVLSAAPSPVLSSEPSSLSSSAVSNLSESQSTDPKSTDTMEATTQADGSMRFAQEGGSQGDRGTGYPAHHTMMQIGALAWAHSVIGWGFFILQNWIPTYLGSLGLANPVAVGFLAALPWVSSSLLAFAFGALFERLEKAGMSTYRARTLAHSMASVGAAIPMLVLGLNPGMSSMNALICMGITLSMQTCNYPGFHSYVQEYGSQNAGTILGVTNSAGIITGIVGNLATGAIVVATGSYQLVFLLTGGIYASSFIVWLAMLKGDPIYPSVRL